MKNLYLFIFSILISSALSAQFGYKNKLEQINGIEISYKVVNEKLFDKESPAQIRLKLKNTNEYPVNVKFKIEYSIGFTTSYNSGGVEICIPSKTARTGKMNGLVFELKTNDKNIFLSEDADWEFEKFEVEQIEDCKILQN